MFSTQFSNLSYFILFLFMPRIMIFSFYVTLHASFFLPYWHQCKLGIVFSCNCPLSQISQEQSTMISSMIQAPSVFWLLYSLSVPSILLRSYFTVQNGCQTSSCTSSFQAKRKCSPAESTTFRVVSWEPHLILLPTRTSPSSSEGWQIQSFPWAHCCSE